MKKQFKIVVLIIYFFCFAVPPVLASSIRVDSKPEIPCLSIIPGESNQLVYPKDALERHDGGTVTVDLVFKDAESKPDIRMDGESLANSLVVAVRRYVARYRIPCMKPGDQAVLLHQSYMFIPYDTRRVVGYPTNNDANAETKAQLSCMTNIDGNKQPDYPAEARRRGSLEEAKFYYKLTFFAADKPPSLEWIAAADEASLKRSIMDYANGLRLPCLTDGPVSTKILYKFQIDKGSRTYLKDMSLRQFLGLSGDFPTPAKFDFSTMDCPFDLQMTYMQPFDDNVVREYEQTVPARRSFLDWLTKVSLRLNDEQKNTVLGNILTLKIPCGTVDL